MINVNVKVQRFILGKEGIKHIKDRLHTGSCLPLFAASKIPPPFS